MSKKKKSYDTTFTCYTSHIGKCSRPVGNERWIHLQLSSDMTVGLYLAMENTTSWWGFIRGLLIELKVHFSEMTLVLV